MRVTDETVEVRLLLQVRRVDEEREDADGGWFLWLSYPDETDAVQDLLRELAGFDSDPAWETRVRRRTVTTTTVETDAL